MDIAEAVSTEYSAHDVKTPVSKLRGTFESGEARAVVITNGGDLAGVVSRKDLLSSHHPPEETAMNIARDPPTVQRTEDVRETARLLVESGLSLLPVFEGEQFHGVVTDTALLTLVRENLDALDVGDVATRDLVAVEPETTLGEVINRLRENRISRVPVLDEDASPVGLISIQDLVAFTTRAVDREQGGSPGSFGRHGGAQESGQAHGGYGERAGGEARLLDLPARDVMSTPAGTTTPDEPLGDAVERMLADGWSSLVVVDEGSAGEADRDRGRAVGVVTTTDALRALAVTDDQQIPVQVFNVDLLDTLTREEIAADVESIVDKHASLQVQEVNVIFHEHSEKQRGVSLVLATVRLFTDRGRISGSGEGYGADRAFDAACDVLEENVLDQKGRETATHTRKDTARKQEELERLLGWWLETP